jgi:hypothetical protein
LNNIDNHVCFIWNRYVDRGTSLLDLQQSGSSAGKPAQPAPRPSKPVR